MFNLDCKVALVTGAAGGIGASLSRELLKNGVRGITLTDINEKAGKQLLENINEEFGSSKAIFVKMDVTKMTEFEEAFKQTISTFGNIDILVNNAGILNDKEWETMLPININGVLHGILLGLDTYLPKYKSGPEGVILNVCSNTGLEGFPNMPIYSSTKYAIHGMTRSFGHPYHYERTKVKVLSICPGATESALIENMNDRLLGDSYKSYNSPVEIIIQSSEFLAQQTISVIKNGKPGSLWAIINKKPAYEYHPTPLIS